jgi:hypothetical protein
MNPTSTVTVFRPRQLRVHGLGQVQYALKCATPPLTPLGQDSLRRSTLALASNDQVALADHDPYVFGGYIG